MNDTETKIGVIILNWNAAAQTMTCIRNLDLPQKLSTHIFIIDNGSNENDKVFLQAVESKTVSVIYLQQNMGFSGGMNVGLRAADQAGCDWVLLLNNDAQLQPRGLETLVTEAINTQLDIISARLWLTKEGQKIQTIGDKLGWYLGTTHTEFNGKKDTGQQIPSATIDFVTAAAVLVKLSTIKQLNFFDDNFFTYWEDVDLCLRAKKFGFSIGVSNNVVAYHSPGQSTHNKPYFRIYLFQRARIIFFKKHLGRRLWFRLPLFIIADFFALRYLWRIYFKNGKFFQVHYWGIIDGLRSKRVRNANWS
ncbi:MAG: glycosyltransferase family 2 protein [Candidatus Kerfeldbacteria bacterium]